MSRLAFPFAPANDGRSRQVARGSDAHVRQMIELLVLTMPSERVMRPEFGSPVRQMLFGAGEGPAAIALEAALQASITQWLGTLIELTGLSAEFDAHDAVLDILVSYTVRASRNPGELRIRKGLT